MLIENLGNLKNKHFQVFFSELRIKFILKCFLTDYMVYWTPLNWLKSLMKRKKYKSLLTDLSQIVILANQFVSKFILLSFFFFFFLIISAKLLRVSSLFWENFQRTRPLTRLCEYSARVSNRKGSKNLNYQTSK